MPPEASNTIEALLSRRSVPALRLREPGPSQQQIDAAIDAALRAPDHGGLKPWRFVLIRGAARTRLSQLFVRRLQQREPATPPGKVEKARTMPLTAPLVIAVGARTSSAWWIRSWDRFCVPRPFAQVEIAYGAPFAVAEGKEALRQGMALAEQALQHVTYGDAGEPAQAET